MKYFTFLGMGHKKNSKSMQGGSTSSNQLAYETVVYKLNGKEYVTNYIQECIYCEYSKEISQIVFFVTKESLEIHKTEICNVFKEKKGVSFEFSEIASDITFEDFVQLLSRHLNNDDFIIDITHSFRSIPITLLLSMEYIEMARNSTLRHLFYGQLVPIDVNYKEGNVIDMIKEYKLQKLTSALQLFSNTLKIDIDGISFERDTIITGFLQASGEFNKVLEMCQFDKCISKIKKMEESCKAIEKRKDDYFLLIPIIGKIQSKIKFVVEKKNERAMKIAFINLLLEYELYQIAITFLDQFIREELIRIVFHPEIMNYKFFENIRELPENKFKNQIYEFSQFLIISVFGIRKGVNDVAKAQKFKEYMEKFGREDGAYETYFYDGEKATINVFFSDIRNSINHGSSIKKEIDIKKEMSKLLNIFILKEEISNEQ